VSEIEPPLGISKPNEMAITAFDLPIIKGDLIHCLDVIHALAKYALGSIEDSKEFSEIQNQIDENFKNHFPMRIFHAPITTTMQRKKLEIAARTLQRAWRRFKLQRTVLKTIHLI
jgi:hypothetical protein